jgi:hypothetical protein
MREDGAGNSRDSAITDMGCPNCLLGLACQCASAYFDMEAYLDEAAVAPSAFLPPLESDMGEVQFFSGAELNLNVDGVSSGAWEMQNFPG